MPHNTEEVLSAIRRVLDGDRNAYELIYSQFDRALRAFVGSRYSWAGPDFVDEVAVRTHSYALTRLAKFDPARSAFLTWLCWQARSTASRVIAEWYAPRFVQFELARHEARAGTAPGPADYHEAERSSRVIREAMGALSEEGRLAVTHLVMAGRTLAETAQATGLSVSKLRRERERALAVLKRRLVEAEVLPIEVDTTPAPIIYGRDWTDRDDDYTASVTAVLPDSPDTLSGAKAAERPEEEDPET